MIALSEATASNERIPSTFPDGLVAVFVGGTSGVGEYTVKRLAKYSPNLRAYIVGRSQEAADRILKECREIRPDGHFEFLKADISLVKGVDEVCQKIRSKESSINLLFETQGGMGFSKVTSEGVPLAFSLVAHSRMRFILNLLPFIQRATGLRRVVSVACATCEGPIDLDNIPAQGFSLHKMRDQNASIQTLLLEEAARRAPDVSFIHTVPGVVKSGIMRDAEGLSMNIIIAISKLLTPFIQTPPDECAEYHAFFATSAIFPPARGAPAGGAVIPDKGRQSARGTDGKVGSGIYSISNKGESASPKVENLLATFRGDGTAKAVWGYVEKDFQRITGTISI